MITLVEEKKSFLSYSITGGKIRWPPHQRLSTHRASLNLPNSATRQEKKRNLSLTAE